MVEKGGYSERFCVRLWPMFSVLLSAFSVKAPWRLHALLYGEHWIILLGFFLHHYRFVITVEKVIKFYFAVDESLQSHVLTLRLGCKFKASWTKLTCPHGIIQQYLNRKMGVGDNNSLIYDGKHYITLII